MYLMNVCVSLVVVVSVKVVLCYCLMLLLVSKSSSSVLVQRLYVQARDQMLQWVPVTTCTALNRYRFMKSSWRTLYFWLSCTKTGYRSALNDFQRSEGRELVPTSWNSDRVQMLPGLNLEDCATRCSQSLDCRYPPTGMQNCYCSITRSHYT